MTDRGSRDGITSPRYGVLFPNGLLSWAEQAAQTAAGVAAAPLENSIAAGQITANGGALASAVILIVMSLVLSIGFFEQQEV